MNLQRHYGALSLRERLSIYVAAVDRGDMAERLAVWNASPSFQVVERDLYVPAVALEFVVCTHRLAQTDMALLFVLALEASKLKRGEPAADAAMSKAYNAARRWLAREAAFRSFCADYGADYVARSDALDAGALVSQRQVGEQMAALVEAFDREHAEFGEDFPVDVAGWPTPEAERREYDDLLQMQMARLSPA